MMMKKKSVLNKFYSTIGKRMIDILASIGILFLCSPFLIIILVLQLIFHKGKIFFKQQRPGYKGKLFYMLKFKTMNDAADADGNLLTDVKRLTPWGNLLRKTSLDELPQLFNILKGEMTLVGPRPLLVEYLQRYTERQMRRHDVKPGVTGWAQINGRNSISWDQKFELDIWYTEHISFWLDVKILFRTVRKVLFAEEINHTGHATMPVYKGVQYDDEKE